jgi:Family of unknown function (DUF5677)
MTERQDMIVKFRHCGRNLLDVAIPLLEGQRAQADLDLYQPEADEVLGGLFARVFRYCQTFLLDYHLWAVDLGQVVLRMMLESVFYMTFLSNHDEHEIYVAFQRYGMGQEKLYKLQLQKLIEEGSIQETPELREFVHTDSDEEIPDELINVTLKNFMDLRKVAEGAGMKQEYVLRYQPESVITHGHWPALRQFHLVRCNEPLHRMHYQPFFGLPGLDEDLRLRALLLLEQAYQIWRSRYKLDDVLGPLVEEYLKCCDSDSTTEDSTATES